MFPCSWTGSIYGLQVDEMSGTSSSMLAESTLEMVPRSNISCDRVQHDSLRIRTLVCAIFVMQFGRINMARGPLVPAAENCLGIITSDAVSKCLFPRYALLTIVVSWRLYSFSHFEAPWSLQRFRPSRKKVIRNLRLHLRSQRLYGRHWHMPTLSDHRRENKRDGCSAATASRLKRPFIRMLLNREGRQRIRWDMPIRQVAIIPSKETQCVHSRTLNPRSTTLIDRARSPPTRGR